MKFLKICILTVAFVGSSANAVEKNEIVKVKYELMHEVCHKGQCKSQSVNKGAVVLELERETDRHFWSYKAVNFVVESLDIQIRFKAVLLKNKGDLRTFELGFAERKKAPDMQQISWGEGSINGGTWPIGYSMVVLGNTYELNGKTIIPSVKTEIVKN